MHGAATAGDGTIHGMQDLTGMITTGITIIGTTITGMDIIGIMTIGTDITTGILITGIYIILRTTVLTSRQDLYIMARGTIPLLTGT